LQHVKPEGIVVLDGYSVEIVDEPGLLALIPPSLELFRLVHKTEPSKRTYYLIANDKALLTQWVQAIVHEASAIHGLDDWDEIEAKRTRMLQMQDELRKQASVLRLKKTENQTYAIDPKEIKLVQVLGGGSFGTVRQPQLQTPQPQLIDLCFRSIKGMCGRKWWR